MGRQKAKNMFGVKMKQADCIGRAHYNVFFTESRWKKDEPIMGKKLKRNKVLVTSGAQRCICF